MIEVDMVFLVINYNEGCEIELVVVFDYFGYVVDVNEFVDEFVVVFVVFVIFLFCYFICFLFLKVLMGVG